MPYSSAQATVQVTVLAVSLTDFTVTPSQPWRAGQTVTLRVKALQGSTPRVGKTIRFLILDVDTGATTYVDAVTGSDGYATASYTIPWTIDTSVIPCGVIRFRAYDLEANVLTSPIDGQVAYPTRITISAPTSVPVNQAFTISGKLEYQSTPTAWSPLSGRTVSVYYDNTKIGDVTTDANGNYSINATITTAGTYTLKAVYAGQVIQSLALTVLATAAQNAVTFMPLITGILSVFVAMRRR